MASYYPGLKYLNSADYRQGNIHPLLKVKCSSIEISRIPPKLKMRCLVVSAFELMLIVDIGHIRYDEGIYPESNVRLGFGYLIALCSPAISNKETTISTP
jgi:hypothetical protein